MSYIKEIYSFISINNKRNKLNKIYFLELNSDGVNNLNKHSKLYNDQKYLI